MTTINKKKTATLRKIAEDKGIKGWEDMERKDLIAALSPVKVKAQKDSTPPTAPALSDVSEKPKEEAPIGISEEHVSVGSKAERMKAHLAKQPKVRILIPLEGKEKLGITETVILNGYRLNVMKGVYVEVPEQVAEIIMKSQRQTVEALNNPLNLENPDHPRRKSGEGLSGVDA